MLLLQLVLIGLKLNCSSRSLGEGQSPSTGWSRGETVRGFGASRSTFARSTPSETRQTQSRFFEIIKKFRSNQIVFLL